MDVLDRLLGHDAWTTRQLLLLCRDLSEEQFDREFDIGFRSLRRTFAHIIWNMEVWTGLIAGLPVPPSPDESGTSVARLLERLAFVAADLEAVATRITREGGLDELWVDHLDQPPTRKSYGGAIAHVLTHSMHHRAQVLYLLRLLGVQHRIEGDVLSWEAQREC